MDDLSELKSDFYAILCLTYFLLFVMCEFFAFFLRMRAL